MITILETFQMYLDLLKRAETAEAQARELAAELARRDRLATLAVPSQDGDAFQPREPV